MLAERSNTGCMPGKRRSGGQRWQWLDDVTDWTGMKLPQLVTLAKERKAYRQFAHRVVQAPHGVWHPDVSAGTRYDPESVSVCHKSVFYRNGWTNRAGFWHGSFLRPILHCVVKNSGSFENKGISLWNFAPNSGLRKFRHSISIIEACYQLSSRKVDAQSVIIWAAVGQLDNTSELRRSTTVVYYSDRQALSTARRRPLRNDCRDKHSIRDIALSVIRHPKHVSCANFYEIPEFMHNSVMLSCSWIRGIRLVDSRVTDVFLRTVATAITIGYNYWDVDTFINLLSWI